MSACCVCVCHVVIDVLTIAPIIEENEAEPDSQETHEAESTIDQMSMKKVLGACSDFKNVKSLIERAMNARGHIVKLSSKYHAECAGIGIEYDFGRAKWWFRKHNRHSTASLRRLSADAFNSDVVSLFHTRKFARKARDYMRAYRVPGGCNGSGIRFINQRTQNTQMRVRHPYCICNFK